MRHAVIGANGQLGRELLALLPGEVVALDRTRLDLARPDAVAAVLDAIQPDVVLNCAAYNHVDRAEAEPDAVMAVNAWGVRALARWCGQKERLLVHFSTDHVFGLERDRRTPYRESDPPGPVSAYGLSKLAGEYLVRSLCPRHLVLRTCGLYGPRGIGGKGTNFVETVLRIARSGRPMRIVDDQVCTPTNVTDLAQATLALLAEGRTGLFHRTNDGACTWHAFARAVLEIAGLPQRPEPITTAEYGAAAPRPAWSVLDSVLPPLRPWEMALADHLEQRVRA